MAERLSHLRDGQARLHPLLRALTALLLCAIGAASLALQPALAWTVAATPAAMLAATAPATAPAAWRNPLDTMRVTGFFGVVRPMTPQGHRGIDLGARRGTPVHAAADGIASVSEDARLGKAVRIDHGGGVESLYAHLDRVNLDTARPSRPDRPSARWAIPAWRRDRICISRSAATGACRIRNSGWPAWMPMPPPAPCACARSSSATEEQPVTCRPGVTGRHHHFQESPCDTPYCYAASRCHGRPPCAPTMLFPRSPSAPASEQRRNDTVSTITIGHDELVRQGDRALLDVLKRLPGITVARRAWRRPGPANPAARPGPGLYPDHARRRAVPTGFALDSLDPELVERVEIQRAATAEFSAQAIAGSINIVLKKAAPKPQREFKLGASASAGRGAGSATVQWSGKQRKVDVCAGRHRQPHGARQRYR